MTGKRTLASYPLQLTWVREYFVKKSEMEAVNLEIVYEQVSTNLPDIANVPNDMFQKKVLPELPKLKKTDPATTQLAKNMHCLFAYLSEDK